jgi:hypothetical protein
MWLCAPGAFLLRLLVIPFVVRFVAVSGNVRGRLHGLRQFPGRGWKIAKVVGFFEVFVSEPQDVDGQEKTPKPFARRRFRLTGAGCHHRVLMSKQQK